MVDKKINQLNKTMPEENVQPTDAQFVETAEESVQTVPSETVETQVEATPAETVEVAPVEAPVDPQSELVCDSCQ